MVRMNVHTFSHSTSKEKLVKNRVVRHFENSFTYATLKKYFSSSSYCLFIEKSEQRQ